jgi:hypothetical protein
MVPETVFLVSTGRYELRTADCGKRGRGRGKEGGKREEEGQEEEAVWMFKF